MHISNECNNIWKKILNIGLYIFKDVLTTWVLYTYNAVILLVITTGVLYTYNAVILLVIMTGVLYTYNAVILLVITTGVLYTYNAVILLDEVNVYNPKPDTGLPDKSLYKTETIIKVQHLMSAECCINIHVWRR